MWTFIHRPRNTGANPVKLSGPTGRFYTLFQASTANCFCSDSAFVSSRELSLKIRAARIRGSFVQLSPPRLALTEAIRGNCAMKVPFRAYVLVISLAATQLSCGGGGSSAAPPPSSSPAPKMSHVFLVVEENHSFNSVIGSPNMPS